MTSEEITRFIFSRAIADPSAVLCMENSNSYRIFGFWIDLYTLSFSSPYIRFSPGFILRERNDDEKKALSIIMKEIERGSIRSTGDTNHTWWCNSSDLPEEDICLHTMSDIYVSQDDVDFNELREYCNNLILPGSKEFDIAMEYVDLMSM